KPGEELDGAFAQSFALYGEPVLEGAPGQGQSGQKVSTVQRRRALQRCEVLARGALELLHVHPYGFRIQRHAVALDDQSGAALSIESLPDRKDRLAQSGSAPARRQVVPEKRDEFLARVNPPGGDRQEGEKSPVLARGHGEARPGPEPYLETAKECQVRANHALGFAATLARRMNRRAASQTIPKRQEAILRANRGASRSGR